MVWLLADLRRLAAGAALLLTGLVFWNERERDSGAVLLFDESEVRRLCASSGYQEEYFWERARTVGIGAGLLRSESLSAFVKDGRAALFTDEEIARVRATGTVQAEAPFFADSVWVFDPALAKRVFAASHFEDFPVSTTSYGGKFVFYAADGAARGLSAGYDSDRAALLRASGIIPAYFVSTPKELLMAAAEPGPRILWLESMPDAPAYKSVRITDPGRIEGEVWAALAPPPEFAGSPAIAAGLRSVRTGAAAVLDSDFPPREALHKAKISGKRFLLLRTAEGEEIDGVFDRARAAVISLRRGGVSGELPSGRSVLEPSVSARLRSWIAAFLFIALPFAVLKLFGGFFGVATASYIAALAARAAGSLGEFIRPLFLGEAGALCAAASAGGGAFAAAGEFGLSARIAAAVLGAFAAVLDHRFIGEGALLGAGLFLFVPALVLGLGLKNEKGSARIRFWASVFGPCALTGMLRLAADPGIPLAAVSLRAAFAAAAGGALGLFLLHWFRGTPSNEASPVVQ